MILALAASLAIVAVDRASLRAAPRAGATELTALWQGDVLEIRGERSGYLKVYNFRHERGGYLRSQVVRPIELSEAAAPELLAVLRFLRESRGSEALGISYGAAYLKAVSPRALTAEPFGAIAEMAERLADAASGSSGSRGPVAAHLDVAEQFGIRMRSFERAGRIQVCYDGELFRRVLALAGASPEERARAALALTRPDCIDPSLGPVMRASVDDERSELLGRINDQGLSATTRSRLHVRSAGVWSSIAFERARRREPPGEAAERALAELLAAHAEDLGDDRRAEYTDAVLRVSASRWAAMMPTPQAGPLILRTDPGDPGQTCVSLEDTSRRSPTLLLRRCTYGIVWLASAQAIPHGPAVVLAVQPMESWRELWIFHETSGGWTVDVLSPGADDPEEGYVDFAGFAPGSRRLLIAREVKARGRIERRFQELRLDDLALVYQANSPDMLHDFGRWADVAWRRDTLALR